MNGSGGLFRSPRTGPVQTHLPGGHLLLLRHFDLQPVVLQLQCPDAIDVDGQPIVEVLQVLFLLQPGYPGRGERRGGRRPARFSGRSRTSGRHHGSVYDLDFIYFLISPGGGMEKWPSVSSTLGAKQK